MDYKLIIPRGEPPIPGKTETKEETLVIGADMRKEADKNEYIGNRE